MSPPPLKPHEASALLAGTPPAESGRAARPYYEFEAAGEACARLVGNILERRGIVLLTGEPGAGKTLALQRLVGRPGLATHGAYVPGEGSDIDSLRVRLAHALGIPDVGSGEPHDAQAVNTALVEVDKEHGTAVLAIDDADSLPDDVLDRLPELAPRDPESGSFLLQIVLAGRPPLLARLERAELRALRAAIADRIELTGLRTEELEGYVRHWLQQAGRPESEHLLPGIVAELAEYAERNPGRLSALCHEAWRRSRRSEGEAAAGSPEPAPPAVPSPMAGAAASGLAATEAAPPDNAIDEDPLDPVAAGRQAILIALERVAEAQRVARLAQAPSLAKASFADAEQVSSAAAAAAGAGDLDRAISSSVAARKLYAEATAQALRRIVPPLAAAGLAMFVLFASFPSQLRIPALVVVALGALIAGMPAADARRRKPPSEDSLER